MKKVVGLITAVLVTFGAAPAAAAPSTANPPRITHDQQPTTASTMAQGSRGENVRALQARLSQFGYAVTVDGVFGPRTEAAVRHWQRANGLLVDGIVGPVTLGTLRINGAASQGGLEPAERVAPPPPIIGNDQGLNGLPFAPAGLDACAEMNWWRVQAGLPERFSDQPRTPAVSFGNQGYGWRESGCDNTQVSSTGCCVGYWQIHTGNFTAPGYKAGIAACGVSRRSDILGNEPLQKQKQACVAKVLYDVSGLTPWRL